MTLSHLTLNTADLRESPRAEVGPAAIAALARWARPVDRLAHPLPGGLPLCARAARAEADGWAQLDVWTGPHLPAQVAQAVLVWTSAAADRIWPRIVAQSRALGIAAGLLRRPAQLPWLAVALTPAAAALPPDTLMALGDLERCWAWAVLETVSPSS